MLDTNEINSEIMRLESGETVWDSMNKLSMLYTVRDHFQAEIPQYSQRSEATPQMDGSEFLQACSGVDIEGLLKILDEHMDAIKLLHNREYRAIIRRIDDLRG